MRASLVAFAMTVVGHKSRLNISTNQIHLTGFGSKCHQYGIATLKSQMFLSGARSEGRGRGAWSQVPDVKRPHPQATNREPGSNLDRSSNKIYWRGEINQLSRANRSFSHLFSLLVSLRVAYSPIRPCTQPNPADMSTKLDLFVGGSTICLFVCLFFFVCLFSQY